MMFSIAASPTEPTPTPSIVAPSTSTPPTGEYHHKIVNFKNLIIISSSKIIISMTDNFLCVYLLLWQQSHAVTLTSAPTPSVPYIISLQIILVVYPSGVGRCFDLAVHCIMDCARENLALLIIH